MGRPILLVLLVLLMVPLGAQSPATPLQVPYQQFRLANGLNVILHRDTSIPAVAVNVWYTSAPPTRSRDAPGSRISSST